MAGNCIYFMEKESLNRNVMSYKHFKLSFFYFITEVKITQIKRLKNKVMCGNPHTSSIRIIPWNEFVNEFKGKGW